MHERLRAWQSCVWQSCVCERDVCEKAVCERVVCDKAACDKAACEKDVCERLRVTKLCVRDKILFERDGLTCSGMSPSAMPATQTKRRCHQAPRLPRKTNVDVTKRHACRANRRLMSPSATPATQSATGDQRGPSATRSSPVPEAPCLPHKTKVDAARRHACHAKCRGATGDQRRPSAPREPVQSHKRYACHAKQRPMSPSAKPATQSSAAPRATNGAQARHQPRKTKVAVANCQACKSAAPPRATSGDPARHQSQRSVIGAMQNEGRCRQLPSLQRKVPRRHGRPAGTQRATRASQCHKCHACHAKRRSMSPSARPATQSAAAPRATNGATGDQRRPSESQPSLKSATRATQNEGGCRHMQHLPRRWMWQSGMWRMACGKVVCVWQSGM